MVTFKEVKDNIHLIECRHGLANYRLSLGAFVHESVPKDKKAAAAKTIHNVMYADIIERLQEVYTLLQDGDDVDLAASMLDILLMELEK